MENTGYWLFYCNPKQWAIDEFLEEGSEVTTWKVTKWQKDFFHEGQHGIIRVGVDSRNKKELHGKPKLKSGIYAIVQVIRSPEFKTDEEDQFWIDNEKKHEETWRVKLRIIKNLLDNPVSIDDLRKNKLLSQNEKLIGGFRTSSWALSESNFKEIYRILESNQEGIEFIKAEPIFDIYDIINLENRYKDATPRQKEIISTKIERGEIAKAVKKLYNYECLICKKLGEPAHSFKKLNGEYYVETHHFFPVSKMMKGSLGITNLMTLCANHHRQMHYGNVQIIDSNEKFFELKIEGETLKISKINIDDLPQKLRVRRN